MDPYHQRDDHEASAFADDLARDIDRTGERARNAWDDLKHIFEALANPETKAEKILTLTLCATAFTMAYNRGAKGDDEPWDKAKNALLSAPFGLPVIACLYLPYAVLSCSGNKGGFFGSKCVGVYK